MMTIGRCGFRLLLACSFWCAFDGSFRAAVHAETRTAAALTPEAVSAAIDAAQDGDTVQLPAGTADWPKGWNSLRGAKMKAITIQGAGMDKTVICDRRSRGYFVPFELHGVEGKPFRVTGIQLTHERSFCDKGGFGVCDGQNPVDGNQIPAGQTGAGYPCMGQPGRGTDADGDGVFEPSPCYAWNNTFNGAKLNMALRPWRDTEQLARQAEHVKEGRDFFNEEPPAGYYKPYVYPHPLQEGWEALMKSVAAPAAGPGNSTPPPGSKQ